jgi:hypothetical protein
MIALMEGNRSAEPAPETAEALLAMLCRLEDEGRLRLRIEPSLLTHIDSPVASEADGNIWVYGALAVAAVLWLWRGAVPGLLAFAVGLLVYFTLGRAYMHRRIERRVREQALGSIESWRRLWRFRGLTLSAADRPGLAECASPDGNWMAFVRALR